MTQPQTESVSEKYPWIVRLSESKLNYWANYVIYAIMIVFFLAYDGMRLGVSAYSMVGLWAIGYFVWTFSEYVFHRWMYHMGLPLTVEGHMKHHDDPTALIAMPFIVSPLLFLPIHGVFSVWLQIAGFSSVLSGWFGGYAIYSLMHHSLHHYKMPFSWLRHLQSQHRIHHALPDANFGVTTRFWDRVFGTEFVKESRRAQAD
jgi:sterol desaturase/sphingolipid hydroxylase (fatty acid hydroxylase superfamily)